MPDYLVSVIVPTYNSQGNIEQCLVSIRKQSNISDLEVIVVDNYSQDRTAAIAAQYARVYLKGPERCAQRNYGANLSSGDLLFFVDSDMELYPDVISECVAQIDDGASGVVVPEVSLGIGFWAKCKALERSCYLNDSLIEAPRFFKRDAFVKVGGYDENLVAAEDWDLSIRLQKNGCLFSRTKSFIKHNEGRLSLQGTIAKKYKYGKSINRYMLKHKAESAKQFVFIRPAFLKNYKCLFRNPGLSVGMIFMKFCEFSAGFLGLFSARVADKLALNRKRK